MSGFIPKEKLTAYQRWEFESFDPPKSPANTGASDASNARETSVTSINETAIVLPTAEDIERIHSEAQAQGYAAGFEEGRNAGFNEGHQAGSTQGEAAGHALGFEQGYPEGQEKGFQAGLAEANTIVGHMNTLLNGLNTTLKSLDQEIANSLLATAMEIAHQVLRQSLAIKPELILPVVQEAIASIHSHSMHTLLFIHPDDAELIRTHFADHIAHSHWRIMEDPSITRGGCRVEHGHSEADATLETRLKRVTQSMGITDAWLKDTLQQ